MWCPPAGRHRRAPSMAPRGRPDHASGLTCPSLRGPITAVNIPLSNSTVTPVNAAAFVPPSRYAFARSIAVAAELRCCSTHAGPSVGAPVTVAPAAIGGDGFFPPRPSKSLSAASRRSMGLRPVWPSGRWRTHRPRRGRPLARRSSVGPPFPPERRAIPWASPPARCAAHDQQCRACLDTGSS